MIIDISKKDYEYLKFLQHELETQDNMCTNNPIYAVCSYQEVPTSEEYQYCYFVLSYNDGDYEEIFSSDGLDYHERKIKFNETMERYMIDNYLEDGEQISPKIKELLNEDPYDYEEHLEDIIYMFNAEHGYKMECLSIHYIMERRDTEQTFLTEAEAKKHIEINGHNYRKPHIYVLSAFRHNEYDRLTNFIRSIE
ncbi:hypothetical protein [uncultured Arcobacter sp.]|uniref:hypothetical protein n=1 Tax=uncultured Arcobacter sp. TaxID=165434 RepID=UPI00262976F2|nr:hypothetical protein [uncultured Arcobacter sp.]